MTPSRTLASGISLVVMAVMLAVLAAVPAVAQTPSPTPSSSASPSPSASSHASPSPSPSPSQGSPSPEPGPHAAVDVSVASPVLLGQVGDTVTYSINVEVTEPTPELVVVTTVAPELDVAGVPLNDAVESMAFGRHGDDEDIVWVLEDVTPGAPVELIWHGLVAQAGDLEATSVVEARTDDASATDATQTFLASEPSAEAEGTAAPSVRDKVVRMVPVPAAAPDGSLLPVTGWSPESTLWVAAVLLALGLLLIAVSLARPRARQTVALLMVLLVTAACTSDSPEPSAAPTPPTETQEDEAGEDERPDKPKDQVLGIQIRRDPEELEAEQAEEVASTEAESVNPPVTYRRVVVLGPEAPEPVQQPPAEGDNTVSFAWDEGGRTVGTATSGIVFNADQLSTITTALNWSDDGLTSDILLTNVTSEPLRVQGTLVLEIVKDGDTAATLTSDPIDVTLAPEGSVEVGYRYLLPTGEYLVTSNFQT